MYQEIIPKVYHHCRQTGCHNESVQAACLVAALNYHSMGYNADDAVRMTFAPSGEPIDAAIAAPKTASDKRDFRKSGR